MQIREKDPARDIESREIDLRSAGSNHLRSGYGSGNRETHSKPEIASEETVSSHSGFSSGEMQVLSPEETRELIAELSPEERKQWNSYSNHEKTKLLQDVQKKVDRRMQFQPQGSASASAPPRRRDTGEYRIREPGMRSASGRRETGGIRQTGQNGKDPIRSRGNERASPQIRQTGSQSKSRNNSLKDRNDSVKNPAAKRQAVQGESARTKAAPRIKKEAVHSTQKAEGKENHSNRERNQTYKRNASESRQPEQKGMAAKYSSRMSDGTPRESAKEKRQQKRTGEEQAKRKKMFASEFRSTLAQDSKKRENIKQEQLSEEISQAQMEREVGADVVRTATSPLRAMARETVHRARAAVTSMLAGILKYVAGFGGIFLVLMFLVLFVAALLGGIAGEEEENSTGTLYSASGQEIVDYAKEWIGVVKYVWGAGRNSDTDWQDYADCSSFVHGVFNHFGIEVGSTTYAMENIGTVIDGGLSEAVPGDIILFYSGSISPNCSSHVGIYAGDGQMVHCSGGPSNYDVAHAGTGVCMKAVAADGRPYEIRRVVTDVSGSGGNNTDPTNYTQSELELIWAIVAQEDNGSYEGSLAVISTAMNRVDSPQWASCGSNALEQLTAPGQFCYSIDTYWQARLGGNVPDYTKQAVSDCLEKGIRNHPYCSFRSYYTEGSVQIGGGNYYF